MTVFKINYMSFAKAANQQGQVENEEPPTRNRVPISVNIPYLFHTTVPNEEV